jgi:hypothetical protein
MKDDCQSRGAIPTDSAGPGDARMRRAPRASADLRAALRRLDVAIQPF